MSPSRDAPEQERCQCFKHSASAEIAIVICDFLPRKGGVSQCAQRNLCSDVTM